MATFKYGSEMWAFNNRNNQGLEAAVIYVHISIVF